jgi:hypothetical protein
MGLACNEGCQETRKDRATRLPPEDSENTSRFCFAVQDVRSGDAFSSGRPAQVPEAGVPKWSAYSDLASA